MINRFTAPTEILGFGKPYMGRATQVAIDEILMFRPDLFDWFHEEREIEGDSIFCDDNQL